MANNAAKMSGMDVTYKAKSLGMTNKKPSIPSNEMEMNEVMTNTGADAQSFAKMLTKSFGDAYPVK